MSPIHTNSIGDVTERLFSVSGGTRDSIADDRFIALPVAIPKREPVVLRRGPIELDERIPISVAGGLLGVVVTLPGRTGNSGLVWLRALSF